GNTRCKLEFDLTRYKDFNLSFPGFQTPGEGQRSLVQSVAIMSVSTQELAS
ncbi:hypothetical protein BaRGS_00029888, partial [Batillaria attramentaria]